MELPPCLTDTAIRAIKPTTKAANPFDGGGLYLEVAPSGGGKWWRLKYRFQGKEKRISLGTYPTLGLKDARERREQAKKLLAQGIAPSAHKQEAKAAAIEQEQATTFEAVPQCGIKRGHSNRPQAGATLRPGLALCAYEWFSKK